MDVGEAASHQTHKVYVVQNGRCVTVRAFSYTEHIRQIKTEVSLSATCVMSCCKDRLDNDALLFIPSTALTPEYSQLPVTAVRWISGGGVLPF